MTEGTGQGSGSGLKAQWGVGDPQAPRAGAPGSGEQGTRFREAFEAACSSINESLQSVKTSADAAQHQAIDGLRQQLVAQFQRALVKVDPVNPAQAQADIDNVLAAAQALKTRAASTATDATAALAKWQQRAAEFEAGVARVVEMNDAGYAKAAPFLAVADAIRARVDGRKINEALASVDRFLQPLAGAYAEFQKQKPADAPGGLFGSIANAVTGAVDEAAGVAKGVADGAAKVVGKAADQVRGAAAQVAGKVVDTAKGVAHAAGEAVVGAANAVGDSADSVGGEIGEAVGNVVGGELGTFVGSRTGKVGMGAKGASLGQAVGGDAGEALGGLVGDAAHWVAGKVGSAMGQPPAEPPKGMLGRPRSGAAITGKPPTAFKPVKGADGKTLQVSQAANGAVTLLAPPPKIETITFSGGGGKGAALPGAVKALEDSGVLKNVKTVTGASVGSMTAALVAAGITAEEFKEIGNRPDLADQIKGGKSLPEVLFDGGLSGDGLEDVVRTELSRSVSKRIVDYVKAQGASGAKPDPHILDIARKLADGKQGVTFRDLRELSKVIPEIKEVAISGTYMGEVNPKTGKTVKGSTQPQLAIFDADTQPDLEVALAVHASASLPPVFKPVDIPLANGTTGRFQDGGVLNNAPTLDSIGAERQVDPMPENGSMTFVFEDDNSRDVISGKAKPKRSRVNDWFSGAENSAADYGKNRALADRPQDVVMLPLTFTAPGKDGKKGKKKDFTGFLDGTVNFNMKLEDKLKLQEMANDATSDFLKKRDAPQTREFASMEQMLMSVSRDDLAAMADDGLTGAREALEFRDKVVAEVTGLLSLVSAHPNSAAAAKDPKVQAVLARLDQLANKIPDRQAVVAREVNRQPRLDGLIDAASSPDCSDTLKACNAVNDALRARAHAKEVLRDLIYPKMVRTDEDGVDGGLLKQVDNRLRAATSPDEVNDALQLAIQHFRKRRDLLGLKGHKAFAQELEARLMK
jgi:exoenzyme U